MELHERLKNLTYQIEILNKKRVDDIINPVLGEIQAAINKCQVVYDTLGKKADITLKIDNADFAIRPVAFSLNCYYYNHNLTLYKMPVKGSIEIIRTCVSQTDNFTEQQISDYIFIVKNKQKFVDLINEHTDYMNSIIVCEKLRGNL